MAEISTSERKVSWLKVLKFLGCVAVAAWFSWKFQARYHDNGNALSVMTTVVSILAGFLITVMTVVGDERSLRGVNWRENTYYLEQVRRDLASHELLLKLYFSVLVLSFLASMKFEWHELIQSALEYFLLFLACLVMLLSFSLPGQLKRRHLADLEAFIKAHRDQEIASRKPNKPSD